jgi:hypothetical protein
VRPHQKTPTLPHDTNFPCVMIQITLIPLPNDSPSCELIATHHVLPSSRFPQHFGFHHPNYVWCQFSSRAARATLHSLPLSLPPSLSLSLKRIAQSPPTVTVALLYAPPEETRPRAPLPLHTQCTRAGPSIRQPFVDFNRECYAIGCRVLNRVLPVSPLSVRPEGRVSHGSGGQRSATRNLARSCFRSSNRCLPSPFPVVMTLPFALTYVTDCVTISRVPRPTVAR